MDRLAELKMCYIEQFGFDLVIGLCSGLDLVTVVELERIHNEDKVAETARNEQ